MAVCGILNAVDPGPLMSCGTHIHAMTSTILAVQSDVLKAIVDGELGPKDIDVTVAKKSR